MTQSHANGGSFSSFTLRGDRVRGRHLCRRKLSLDLEFLGPVTMDFGVQNFS